MEEWKARCFASHILFFIIPLTLGLYLTLKFPYCTVKSTGIECINDNNVLSLAFRKKSIIGRCFWGTFKVIWVSQSQSWMLPEVTKGHHCDPQLQPILHTYTSLSPRNLESGTHTASKRKWPPAEHWGTLVSLTQSWMLPVVSKAARVIPMLWPTLYSYYISLPASLSSIGKLTARFFAILIR